MQFTPESLRYFESRELSIIDVVRQNFGQESVLSPQNTSLNVGDIVVVEKGRLSHGFMVANKKKNFPAGDIAFLRNLWNTQDGHIYLPSQIGRHDRFMDLISEPDWQKRTVKFHSVTDDGIPFAYENFDRIIRLQRKEPKLNHAQRLFSFWKDSQLLNIHAGTLSFTFGVGATSIIYEAKGASQGNIALGATIALPIVFAACAYFCSKKADEVREQIGIELGKVNPDLETYFPKPIDNKRVIRPIS